MEPQPISIDGRVTMQGLVWGDEADPVILALHGWLDNAGTFAELAPRLAGYCIVAMDLPGQGLSDPLPPGQSYHFNDHLHDIHAILAALPDQRAHLMGHSMGGALASLYAAAFPKEVRSLICIDALGPISEPADKAASRLRKALEARMEPVPEGRYFSSWDEVVDARVAARRLDRASAERLAERGVEKTDRGWRWSADRRHYWPSITRFTEEHEISMLNAVEAPTLLIRAADSQYKMPQAMLERRVNALADAQVLELEGAHHLHLDHAQPVAEAILAFLEEVD